MSANVLAKGQRLATDVAEDVEFILEHDHCATATHIAARLGYRDSNGVMAALKRAGRDDLRARLTRNAKVAP